MSDPPDDLDEEMLASEIDLDHAYEGLGEAIRSLRVGKGLSRHHLSDAADISVPYLSKIERGDRRPQPTVLARLAEQLGLSAPKLLSLAQHHYEVGQAPSRASRLAAGVGAGAAVAAMGGAPGVGALAAYWHVRQWKRSAQPDEEAADAALSDEQQRRVRLLDDLFDAVEGIDDDDLVHLTEIAKSLARRSE